MAYLNGSYKIWTNVNQSNFIWWPQGKRKYWDRLHNWIASIRILNTRLQVIHYRLLLFQMVTKGWIIYRIATLSLSLKETVTYYSISSVGIDMYLHL